MRRDEVYSGKRMQEIHEEIAPYALDSQWEVFAVDEVRMQLEAITRRAWLKRGRAHGGEGREGQRSTELLGIAESEIV